MGLCVPSLGFDLSVFDVLGLLGFGAGLYVADEVEQRDPELLLGVLLEQPITFWNSAPTTLAQLGPRLAARAGHPGAGDLRLVFLSGDYTPLSLPDDVRSVFRRAEIVSLGGATEATVWSNWFRVGPVDPEWRSIPYGTPIANARYYVLDAELRAYRPGAEGDLFIAGEVLSAGYHNQPALTAERFVPDPFAPEPGSRSEGGPAAARFGTCAATPSACAGPSTRSRPCTSSTGSPPGPGLRMAPPRPSWRGTASASTTRCSRPAASTSRRACAWSEGAAS